MADGKRIQAVGPTGKKYWRDIGWEDQKWAMAKLLPKIAADLSAAGVEVSGPDKPAPLEVEVLDPRELARQVALILYRGDPKRLTNQSKE